MIGYFDATSITITDFAKIIGLSHVLVTLLSLPRKYSRQRSTPFTLPSPHATHRHGALISYRKYFAYATIFRNRDKAAPYGYRLYQQNITHVYEPPEAK
jgi:hypothetical protein